MKKFICLSIAVFAGVGCAGPQPTVELTPSAQRTEARPSRVSSAVLTAPKPAGSPASEAPSVASRYRLGKGDVFSINVFNEPDLSKAKIKMSDAGTMQYISLGEVRVEGMSVADLEALITKTLKGSYLTDPKVTVSIDEYRPVFMSGQVAKTGAFPYQPGLTVLRAITIAGGFAPRADERKLYIQKEDNPGQLIQVGPNTFVEPGDIISVGESFF